MTQVSDHNALRGAFIQLYLELYLANILLSLQLQGLLTVLLFYTVMPQAVRALYFLRQMRAFRYEYRPVKRNSRRPGNTRC